MKPISAHYSAAQARRLEYYKLRDEGIEPLIAATQLGIASIDTARRYEHWYKARDTAVEFQGRK